MFLVPTKWVIPTKKFTNRLIVYNTNMDQELITNIKTFFRSAELVYQSKDYTSAAMLYFKTLFVALDLIILRKLKKTPQDPAERFRILEKDFPEEYVQLDKYFLIYRSTYSTTIDHNTCEEIKQYVSKTIKEKLGI